MVFSVLMVNKVMVNKVEDEERAGLLQHSVHHQRYGGGAGEEIFKRGILKTRLPSPSQPAEEVEIKFSIGTDHWRRCLIGQAGDVFMWRSLFSLASSPTSC